MMSLLRIHHYPDPVLKQKAAPVTAFDAELRRLAHDMLETMYAAPGVGLAAPQVGVSRRLIVLDCSPKDSQQTPLVAVNPEIVAGEGECCEEEGCLSVPGLRGRVPRFTQLRYTGVDAAGQPIDRTVSGFHARVVQHECDHLDGVLYPMRIRDMRFFGFEDVLRTGAND